jgi:hypothetical protein
LRVDRCGGQIPMNDGTPLWTTLPPLPLCDAETAQVESLESYFQRLGYICGQPSQRLLNFLDRRSERKMVWNAKIRAGLNGPGTLFTYRLDALEKITGVPLKGATLLALNEVLSTRASGLAGTARRWCPACLLEAQQHPATAPSDRLLWNFAHYSRCGLHDVDIERRCRRCGLEQPYGRSIPSRFFCLHCKEPLAHVGSSSPRQYVLEWANGVIEELIHWTSMQSGASIPSDRYKNYLEALSATANMAVLKERAWPLYSEIRCLRSRNPSIRVLLNLAALQGVTVLDILLQPTESASKPLFAREHEFEAIPFPAISIPRSAAKVHQIIVELLHASVALLPPLILLCRRSQITVEHYAIYYPQDATRYRKAVARQRRGPSIAPVPLSRAFRIGLHLIEVGHVESNESSAEDRLKVLTGLAPDQCRVVLEACRVIERTQ